MKHRALSFSTCMLMLLFALGATFTAAIDDHDVGGGWGLPATDARRPSAESPNQHNSTTDYVYPTAETEPLEAPPHDLDDAAVWFNEHDPAESLIIGTNKADGDLNHAGLRSWNLDGSTVQTVRGLHTNNIDVQPGFELNGRPVPIALTVSRAEGDWGFRAFTIDTDPDSSTYRELREISGSSLSLPYQPYGSALYHSTQSGDWYAFVSSREAPFRIDQFELTGVDGAVELVSPEPVRSITFRPSYNGTRSIAFTSVIEGMTVDQDDGVLYANEEQYGLHQYSADPHSGTAGRTIDTLTTLGGKIRPDAEGVSLITTGETSGFIVAAGQNGWERARFEVYDRNTHEHVKSFQIVANPGDEQLDEVKGTDGIAMYLGHLNDAFPCGIFIAHGDQVDTGESTFKLVPLDRIFTDRNLPVDGCRER